MNRRKYLACVSAGVAGGLGGCVGESSSGMHLSLVSTDEGPGTLAFDVEMVENRLASSTLPLVDITVENTGEEPETWLFAPTGVSVFEIVFPCTGVTPDKLIIGFEQEVSSLLTDKDSCARTEGEIRRGQAPTEAELAPGRSLEQRYAIAGKSQTLDSPCPPADTYRTECVYLDSDPIEAYGRWGFEFELTPQEG